MSTFDFESVWPLLRECGSRPYAFHESAARAGSLDVLFQRRARSSLAAAGAEAITADGDGFAVLVPLAWDSDMFGMSAARLDHVTARDHAAVKLAAAVAERAEQRRLAHVTLRLGASQLALVQAFASEGFELIDGIQTFAMPLAEPPPAPEPGVRLHAPADTGAIAAIARTAYVHDRFHNDAAIGKERADHINEIWLRNSCGGKAADAVWVYAPDGEVQSYVTCKIDRETEPVLGVSIGTIVMVASGSGRRRGATRLATMGALRWFWDQGARIVEVGTQLSNVPATRLYESCGFRTTAVSLTLRRHKVY